MVILSVRITITNKTTSIIFVFIIIIIIIIMITAIIFFFLPQFILRYRHLPSSHIPSPLHLSLLLLFTYSVRNNDHHPKPLYFSYIHWYHHKNLHYNGDLSFDCFWLASSNNCCLNDFIAAQSIWSFILISSEGLRKLLFVFLHLFSFV